MHGRLPEALHGLDALGVSQVRILMCTLAIGPGCFVIENREAARALQRDLWQDTNDCAVANGTAPPQHMTTYRLPIISEQQARDTATGTGPQCLARAPFSQRLTSHLTGWGVQELRPVEPHSTIKCQISCVCVCVF